MFLTCSMSSVLTYICVYWGGNISKQDRDRLDDIVRKAERVVVISIISFSAADVLECQ